MECAWPLTRYKYMDYCIGFYETLIPDGAVGECAGIKTDLQALNDDARNRHVFCYMRNGNTIRLEFDNEQEIAAYRKISGVRTAYGFCVAGRPRYQSVLGLLQGKLGPNNAIGQQLANVA